MRTKKRGRGEADIAGRVARRTSTRGLKVFPVLSCSSGRQVQVTTETGRDEDETRKKKEGRKRSVLELLKKGVLGHFSPRVAKTSFCAITSRTPLATHEP